MHNPTQINFTLSISSKSNNPIQNLSNPLPPFNTMWVNQCFPISGWRLSHDQPVQAHHHPIQPAPACHRAHVLQHDGDRRGQLTPWTRAIWISARQKHTGCHLCALNTPPESQGQRLTLCNCIYRPIQGNPQCNAKINLICQKCTGLWHHMASSSFCQAGTTWFWGENPLPNQEHVQEWQPPLHDQWPLYRPALALPRSQAR